MADRLDSVKRIYIFLSGLLFLVLAARLAHLQLYNWDRYIRASERNRVRNIIVAAPRGQIFDREGRILVDNSPDYSISVIPYEFTKSENAVELLGGLIQEDAQTLLARIEKEKNGDFSPVRIKRQVDFRTLSAIEEHLLDLPGVFHNVESRRTYPGGVNAPHIFGYLGEITSAELAAAPDADYRPGDDMGKSGVELLYERYLRGQAGVKYVEVDVMGREVRDLDELANQVPDPGNDVYMSVDTRIQTYLETSMEGKKGAVVVLDPRNGDILAFLSKPDYNPEVFSGPLAPKTWSALVNHEGHPLYNRASQSLFPPGSTYKLVLAAAGLETGLINLDETVFCPGYYQLGRRAFKCWKKEGHGKVNLLSAIKGSCNVYFYKKGLDVGLDNWARFSKLFRFDQRTDIDLPNESSGTVPDRAYLNSKYGKRGWTKGLVLNLSVGQGDLLTTPLQMAYFTMILANEGIAYRPRLIKKIITSETGVAQEFSSERIIIDGVSRATYKVLKEGMFSVVNVQGGTGGRAWVRGKEVCGKTGTAQNPHGESHAWFIGFAPRKNPEIALCVMIENGGGGGAVAAPVARGVFATYFEEREVAAN